MVLPDEDAAEFADLEAALVAELAPVGARRSGATLVVTPGSQARRPCSRGGSRSPPGGWRGRIGWPPERGWGPVPQPGGQQVELFAERHIAGGGLGLALIRDGNGTRSFETLLRYRGAAMAEFWRALRTLKTLKALQAEQALETGPALAARPKRPAARPPLVHRAQPDEPERAAGRRLEYVPAEPGAPGRTLHEPAAPWLPNQPELGRDRQEAPVSCSPQDAAPRARSNEPSSLGKP